MVAKAPPAPAEPSPAAPSPPAEPSPAPPPPAAPRLGAPRTGEAPPPTPPGRHRPRPARLLLPLLLLAAIGAGWYLWQHLPGASDGRLRASGTVEADDVAISADTTARITDILVREGDDVRQGQLLVQLDDSMQQLQYRQAQGPDVQRLELQIEKLKLRAPVAGRIGERLVRAGEMATPGAPLLTLTPLDELKLTLYVLERDLARVWVGQRVQLTADPYPSERFEGRVTSIANRAEFTPRNIQTPKDRVNLVFAVRVRIPNPDARLRPGLPVDAVFLESDAAAFAALPDAAALATPPDAGPGPQRARLARLGSRGG